jgi:DNA replication and repair protein RecF
VWVERLEVSELRNIERTELVLESGLNLLVGSNAQGKTSLLEAVGLLARGRSFRTEQTTAAIRKGADALRARGTAVSSGRVSRLEVEVRSSTRRFRLEGREVSPREYQGRLEVAVYATDRLRVIRGPMRERRALLDRGAALLWPAYRQAARDYERVLAQRNAALEAGREDLEAWDDRFVELGARVRHRRGLYAQRLRAAMRNGGGLPGFPGGGEAYDLATHPEPAVDEEGHREALRRELRVAQGEERRARRCLVGPHRDTVALRVDGEDAAVVASSGQARSLLLALTLAAIEVYRKERGDAPVALLDDLDSELDEARLRALCQGVAERGQALVTTAHRDWVARLNGLGRVFEVKDGRVRAA